MRQVQSYLAAPPSLAVDEYLSDQLVLPIVLTTGGSFTTGEISLHLETQIAMLRVFCGQDAVEVKSPSGDGRVF